MKQQIGRFPQKLFPVVIFTLDHQFYRFFPQFLCDLVNPCIKKMTGIGCFQWMGFSLRDQRLQFLQAKMIGFMKAGICPAMTNRTGGRSFN